MMLRDAKVGDILICNDGYFKNTLFLTKIIKINKPTGDMELYNYHSKYIVQHLPYNYLIPHVIKLSPILTQQFLRYDANNRY